MKFKFWGVRGSIPTPGANTVKYGGNTTCIEVRTDDNEIIILDAGTGIHALAQQLLKSMPVKVHIFITHTHWDHIQGLPFFTPIFIKGNQIDIYGGQDPVTNQSIQRALAVQLQYSFFPIREAELLANIHYHTLTPGVPIQIGNTRITPTLLNHPVLNFGYRIENAGKSLFFTGDFEPLFNLYDPSDEEYSEFQNIIDAKYADIVSAISKVDALIVDSSYTHEEYPSKKGWGHGTYDTARKLAQQTQAKKLFFTHHEPNRTDAALDSINQNLQQEHGSEGIELILAREGLEIEL